jgi:thiol-disulfide isomerase/thioredoxin
MALTPSAMIELGSAATDFTLYDVVSGKNISLKELSSPIATVIMFICNHCPYVKHINTELTSLANAYIPKGISFIAINSNDFKAVPEDSPENMSKLATELKYPFPYLVDETQAVAKAYEAACTPDFFIYDRDMKLTYRGQLDDSRPSNKIPANGKDIRAALDAMLSVQKPTPRQRPSIGCNIKWKNRNE